MNNSLIRLVLSACVCWLATACASSMQTVKVVASRDMAAASVRVDVVPATTALQAVSVRDYWEPGNTARSQANPTTLHFGPSQPAEQQVSQAWATKKVLVIADLPGNMPDSSAKVALPVSGKGVPSVATVEVNTGGLVVVPAQ